jgi:hypothetical protein
MRKKSFNLQGARFGRVVLDMKEHLTLCPMDISFFGGIRMVFDAKSIA